MKTTFCHRRHVVEVCTLAAQYDQNNLSKSSKDRLEMNTAMIPIKLRFKITIT